MSAPCIFFESLLFSKPKNRCVLFLVLRERGFGQELRENRSELLRKCLGSSNPRLALQLLSDCGMKVQSECLC